MTPQQFAQYVQDVEAAADIALPLLGEAEYVPVVTAAASLASKVAAMVAAKQTSTADEIRAAMAAGDTAANLAAAVKFGAAQ